MKGETELDESLSLTKQQLGSYQRRNVFRHVNDSSFPTKKYEKLILHHRLVFKQKIIKYCYPTPTKINKTFRLNKPQVSSLH